MDSGRASRRYAQRPLPDGIKPLQFSWQAGRNSLHDARAVTDGRDLGAVTVRRADSNPAIYDLVFAFAFAAFIPGRLDAWPIGVRPDQTPINR